MIGSFLLQFFGSSNQFSLYIRYLLCPKVANNLDSSFNRKTHKILKNVYDVKIRQNKLLPYLCRKTEIMAVSKSTLFDKDLQEVSAFFKVLGHPARMAILKFLAETQVCYTGDLSEEIPLGRTTINQHLRELKRLGLIQGIIQGVNRKYCLRPEAIQLLSHRASEFLQLISEDSKNHC